MPLRGRAKALQHLLCIQALAEHLIIIYMKFQKSILAKLRWLVHRFGEVHMMIAENLSAIALTRQISRKKAHKTQDESLSLL